MVVTGMPPSKGWQDLMTASGTGRSWADPTYLCAKNCNPTEGDALFSSILTLWSNSHQWHVSNCIRIWIGLSIQSKVVWNIEQTCVFRCTFRCQILLHPDSAKEMQWKSTHNYLEWGDGTKVTNSAPQSFTCHFLLLHTDVAWLYVLHNNFFKRKIKNQIAAAIPVTGTKNDTLQ